MELNVSDNVVINDAVEQANWYFDVASASEILCLLLIPVVAMLITWRLRRYNGTRRKNAPGVAFINMITPLLSPALSITFGFLAIEGLKYGGINIHLLPFGIKLAAAWFAIQLVISMSSRKSAGWLIACFIMPVTLLHLFDLWDITIDALAQLSFKIGSVELNVYLILRGIVVVLLMQWLASVAFRIMDKRLRRIKGMRASNRTLILKIFQFSIYCVIFLIGMQMLGINLTALGVFSGALGVGLGFGLQKIASNFISGIILLFEKSIEINDLIELADGTVGFIRRTNARYTLLETQDGRDVLIPNEEFISQRVTSWTHSDKHARVEIAVTVTYDSDLELTKKLMLDAADGHKKRVKSRPSTCVLHMFRDSGVEVHLYFWVADVIDGRMEPKSDVMLAILTAFKANNITIAYPQRELRVTNLTDNKPLTVDA